MAYKTQPKGKLKQQSPITWKDEDGDLVVTSLFLQIGVTVNWDRENVKTFKLRVDKESNFKEADDIYELYATNKIMVLRAQKLEGYLLLGPLVEEFRLLSKSLVDYQKSINFDPRTSLGCKIIYPEFLQEAEPRYNELISIFDKLVGLKLNMDEKNLKEDPSRIHYVFIRR